MDDQQPIEGAKVYLFAAGSTGYGEDSVPLLSSALTGHADVLGGYVLSASDGSFSIPGGYSCKSSDQLYVYVLGGNAGLGTNTAIGELAAIGPCPLTAQSTPSFVWVNELSTIAAAYAMAGFAVNATEVSSSGTALALTGIRNAFANANNLTTLSTGTALTIIPSGNATVPQSEMDTLANILAACIHSASNSSAPCATLLSNAALVNSITTDTATAAINIAHNPAANVADLYALQTSTSPYSPALTAVPNDFSIAINFPTIDSGGADGIAIDADGNAWMANGYFSGVIEISSTGYLLSGAGGYIYNLYGPGDVAIDQSGNAWIGNYAEAFPSSADPYDLVELSSSGALLSGSNGYTGGGLDSERGIAMDGTGNVWTVNTVGNSVSKFSLSGVPSSGSPFTGGDMEFPINLAIDGTGNAWVANATDMVVTKLSNSGSILSGAGFTDGGSDSPFGIAVDAQGSIWTTYPDDNAVSYHRIVKYSNSGEVLSGPTGFTGNGVGNSENIAIDGSGNVWSTNYYGDEIIELSNSGTVLSGTNGYANANVVFPYAISVDGSGDVWVSSGDIVGSCNVVEYIGIATPVITPISAGLPATPTADGSSKLGTRP